MKQGFISSKIILSILAFIIVGLAGTYWFSRNWNRDQENRVNSLSSNFIRNIDYKLPGGNDRTIKFKEGIIRFVYPPHNPQAFFTPAGGSEQLLNIPMVYAFDFFEGRFYIEYPYLFLIVSNLSKQDLDSKILVYNLSNNKNDILDVKTCSAYITKVAYQSNTLYWEQYRDWSSSCSGGFKKVINLDF